MSTKPPEPPEDVLPLNVLVTEDVSHPTTIYDRHAGLCMAVVDRGGAHLLAQDWDVPGVYVLLDPIQADGLWGCYVGKAPAGLRSRLNTHIKSKDHWHRAVLVCRDMTHGFNSAEVGWLEGRLHDLLDAAEDARLHNSVRPRDETLPTYERTMLELAVLPVTRVLQLLGYDPSTLDDAPPAAARRTSRFVGITLKQLVNAGVVSAGAKLVSVNRTWPATAAVEADGRVTVNGDSFSTPSAAAAAVRGGATNGWEFWAIEGANGMTPLAVLRARHLETKPGPN